jgi:hypothetical protein
MATTISSEDFLTGLLAALAQREWETLSIRGDRFDQASAAAFEKLEELAPARGLEVLFYVKPHPTYGDSTVMRDAMTRLAQWDLVSFDNPEFRTVRLKITRHYADRIFKDFGLEPALFKMLADRFESVYLGRSARTVA